MKYVRTENAIEEVLKEEGKLLFTRHGYIPKDMAIKASDSIEELCDALVVTTKKGKEFHKYFPTASDSFDDLKKRYYEKYMLAIYGAIWTSKGLIYVAKKNREGQLELL